jgi:acyl carrier protein
MTVEPGVDVLETLYRAVDELNDQLPPAQQLPKSRDTVLLGEGGRLDSLALVSFVVAVEQEFAGRVGLTLDLMSEQVWDRADGPLRTIGTLADFIAEERRRF